MNGECISYKLGEPMKWGQFIELPDEFKAQYIKNIRERFGATDKAIAEMLDINTVTFGKWVRCLNLGKGKDCGGGKKWDKDGFNDWIAGKIVEEYHNEQIKKCDDAVNNIIEEETQSEYRTAAQKTVIPSSGSLHFSGNEIEVILSTIRMMMRSDTRVNAVFSWSIDEGCEGVCGSEGCDL